MSAFPWHFVTYIAKPHSVVFMFMLAISRQKDYLSLPVIIFHKLAENINTK